MKKTMILAAMMMAAACSYAQEKMKVQLTDGSIVEYDVTQVARVFFETPFLHGEAVDLGLSVKWASSNIGATKAEEEGARFAWGETEASEVFNEADYDFTLDRGDDIAGTACDAVATAWGGQWRMPTRSEALELVDQCSWMAATVNGIDGYQVTGPNGNSIFMPATGYKNGMSVDAGEACYYWTATQAGWSNKLAWSLYCPSTGPATTCWYLAGSGNGKFCGMPIRPVYEPVTTKTGGEGATATSPKDMTGAMWYPSFDNDKYYGWRGTDPTNVSNGCFEQSNKNFDSYQNINGMPEGYYTISVQAFYRKGYAADDYNLYTSPNPQNTDHALLYAITSEQEASAPLVCASSAALSQSLGGSAIGIGNGKYIPNDMVAANYWFAAGYYQNSIRVKVGSDGLLRLGLKKAQTIEGDWMIADNWKITYYGTEDPTFDDSQPDANFQATTADILGTWRGEYEGWDRQQRTTTKIRRELVLASDGSYANTLWGAMNGRSNYVVFEKEAGTFVFDAATQTVTYNVKTDSLIDFRTQQLVGYTVKRFFDRQVSSYTEKALFSYPKDGKRRWFMQDNSLVQTDDKTTPVTYTMSKVDEQQPQVVLFEEPYTNWEANPALVKNEMQSRGYILLLEDVTSTGLPYLSYHGRHKETTSLYRFNADEVLTEIDIAFSETSLDELRSYVVSQLGYSFITQTGDGDYVYNVPDNSSYAFVYASTLSDGQEITYVAYIKKNTTALPAFSPAAEVARACTKLKTRKTE